MSRRQRNHPWYRSVAKRQCSLAFSVNSLIRSNSFCLSISFYSVLNEMIFFLGNMKTKRKSSLLFLRIIPSQSQSNASLCALLVFLPASDNRELRLRLHVPPMSLFFVPFKNGFNAVLWRCLHITSKRSKVPLTKTVTLTVRENESLPVSPIFSFLCELLSVFVSLLRLVVFVHLALLEALPDKKYKLNFNKP